MTLRWIPLEALEPHPENSNRMPPRLLEKLKAHIRRTGLYEPLVVRPLPAPAPEAARFQILNGHHRAAVLRDLGHTHARCDVWKVDDEEARMLLATLNRLEGRDDPGARADLLARLANGRSPQDLAALLPEPPEAIERLLRLAQPPPPPAAPESVTVPRPMTFFLTEAQHGLVTEALREAGRAVAPASAGGRTPRAEALERLATWYLESRGRQ